MKKVSAWLMMLIFASCANVVCAQTTSAFSSQVIAAGPSVYLNFNDFSTSFRDRIGGSAFTPSATGTILPRQPGFDSTQPSNTSASFSPTAYTTAPSDAVGDVEWDHPFSFMMQIDNLQWTRSGTLNLFSKGDISGYSGYYLLSLSNSGGYSELCFTMSAADTPSHSQGAGMETCTPYWIDTFPNGYNYNIVVTYDGSGTSAGLNLYVNGLASPYNNTYILSNQFSFGYVSVAVGGSGKNYAPSTAFTSTGGGGNCVVTGTMTATGGVPSGISYTADYGCTSVPTLSLTSATGTGAVLTATLGSASISTATSYPLVISGAVSYGTLYGAAATTTSQTPTLIDEFAVFPSALTQQQIHGLFDETKFYQRLLKPLPSRIPTLVFDDDGCGDSDNIYAYALAIAAQKLGYVNLAGVVDDSEGPGLAVYRQILDEAGLTRVPLGIPNGVQAGSNLCSTFAADAVNPNTPQTAGAYMKAANLYRTVLAANPSTPVDIIMGGSFAGMRDLMQSPADEISNLTGSQLLARDAANGGAIFAQGLGCCFNFSADNSLEDWTAGQYVVSHNGNLPIYWYGGNAQPSGPGLLLTRTSNDPIFQFARSLGTDVRPAWDSLPTAPMLSNAFAAPVTISMSGTGAGYADSTAFTSTGGGPNCHVAGVMLSSGGVPASVDFTSSGCMSQPDILLTAPTGIGETLTATPTITCGTVTITGPSSGTTSSATCSQHYFLPPTNLTNSYYAPILTWFLNSLIDPEPPSRGSGLP
jgi:hypothetical protein